MVVKPFAGILACFLMLSLAHATDDSDADGVPDFKDACPDTPAGVRVGANGCPFVTELQSPPSSLCMITTDHTPYPSDCVGAEAPLVYFEFASAFVSLDAAHRLEQVAQTVKGQKVSLVLRGHTDIIGSSAANWQLSRARAESVASILSGDFGVPMTQIQLESLGASEPAASNETPMGRQQNRRVEILLQIE